MTMHAALTAATAGLHQQPDDAHLAELARALVDPRLDQWADHAPDIPGREHARDELNRLKDLIDVRRGHLSVLLKSLPDGPRDTLLDPALREPGSSESREAAVEAYLRPLMNVRSTVIIYAGFIPHQDIEHAEDLLNVLLGKVRAYARAARSPEEADEAAEKIRKAHAALEDRLRRAACTSPARAADDLILRIPV
jgi:hypothetical protein